jgi:hemolysin activation/secretion protein
VKRRIVFAAGAAAFASSPFSLAYAQTREEIERVPVRPAPETPGQRLTDGGEIERAPCPLNGEAFKDLTVRLEQVEFGDMRGVSADIVRPAYARYIGQTIPLATVCEIRDQAATFLRRAGYLAAVQVPPQRIENGTVKFDVLMAKLVDFQVRGNAGKSEGLISGYLSQISKQQVFNINEAERYLLLARDIPGYDVRLTLRPAGTVPGEVIGEVQVIYTPVEAELNIQNYGSKDVGRFGGLAQIHFNGLFGIGDRLTVGGFSTADFKEQQVLRLGEEIRLGRNGLALVGGFTHAWTHPSLGGGLNLRSRTLVGNLGLRYPLVRRQTRNLFLSGGLDLINQKTRFAGVLITEDRLRVLNARLDFDSIDPGSVVSTKGYSAAEPEWRIGGAIEVRQGISFLNGSKSCGLNFVRCNPVSLSRAEADPTAFVARANGLVEFRPLPALAFSIAPRVQYAPHVTLSYEEFSAGNFTTGRGYDPGTITGNNGVGFAAEVKVGSLVPQSATALAYQGYGFIDAAWTWSDQSAFNGIDPQKLASAGGGLRVSYGDRATLDIGAAVPLRRAGFNAANPALANNRGDVRVLINLTVRLLPWNRR